MNTPTRMRDVAREMGCSVTTVSLALRNSPRVSEAKRRRIQRAAQRLGYRPNPLVSALMARRKKAHADSSGIVAVLTKFDGPAFQSPLFTEFYRELWKGLEQRAAELGFRLEEFPVHAERPLGGRELTRILVARGIRGIVLFPGGGFDRGYPEIDWRHFAVVAAAFHARRMPVHRIASDHALGMEVALAEIERLGYRRPGLAMTRGLDPFLRFAMSGRFLAWQQGRARGDLVPLVPGRGEAPDPADFAGWLRRHRPDVVLSLNPDAHLWMQQASVRVPRQAGFVHLAKKARDPQAGVRFRTRSVGQTSIDILARELYLNRFGLPETPEVILVAGRWEDGPTVRAQGNG